MRYLILLFWLIIVGLALTFTALNAKVVAINYYFGTTQFHLPVLMLIMLVIGLLLGIIVMLPSIWRAKGLARQCKKAAKNSEKELTNLRTMPLKEEH